MIYFQNSHKHYCKSDVLHDTNNHNKGKRERAEYITKEAVGTEYTMKYMQESRKIE